MVYDFRTREEDAVNAVRRMIEVDKVVAIVGANGSGINNATKSVVNALKFLVGNCVNQSDVTVDPNTGKPIPILSESALLIPIGANRLLRLTI